MHPRLLDLLRCPDCGARLDLSSTGEETAPREDLEEGTLACSACERSWPIVRGVPRLAGKIPEDVRETGERFGYEWTTYTELRPDYEEQFLAWIGPADRASFRGKTVLDAGCGKGRHLALAEAFGADRAVGVDVGTAVEAARANTRDLEGVEVVQANLLALPLAPSFDLVYCVGVLHHLPDPAEGFRSLASRLAPGGRIHVWVYGHEGNAWIRWLFDPVRRGVLRHLPPFLLEPLSWLGAIPLALVGKLYRLLERRAPGVHRRLFYRGYMTFLGGMPFRSVRWIVFDQMVAPTTHYIRREQLESWLEEAGLEETGVESLRGMSWRGWGRMPSTRAKAGASKE